MSAPSGEDGCDTETAALDDFAREYSAFRRFRRNATTRKEGATQGSTRRVGTYNLLNGGGDRFPS